MLIRSPEYTTLVIAARQNSQSPHNLHSRNQVQLLSLALDIVMGNIEIPVPAHVLHIQVLQ